MDISKEAWNARACAHGYAEFLQSYEWGEFQRALGRDVLRKSNPQFFFSAIRMKLPYLGSYWYIPRGPFLSREHVSAWQRVICETAFAHKAAFLRFEPICEKGEEHEALDELKHIATAQRVRQTKDMQPRAIWVIDLSKTQSQLLADMHPKTRYNVRLAERKGVSVFRARTGEALVRACETFFILARKTSRRHAFRLHPERYYRIMAQTLGKEGMLSLYLAKYREKDITGAIVVRYGDTAAYLHGGSDEAYRDMMAPHALHWSIMRDMQQEGAQWYDMGGVEAHGGSRHHWAGITRFKQSFGGSMRCYAGTYDLIFNMPLYALCEWFRGTRRGYSGEKNASVV